MHVIAGCQPIPIFLLNSYILGPNPIFLSTSYIPIISPIFLKYFLYFQENLLSMNDHIYIHVIFSFSAVGRFSV